MKTFLKKLTLFIFPIILVSFVLDHFLSGILEKSDSYADSEYAVWNDLYSGKVNSDIVIYGSSRAWRHIDPTMISDSLHTTAYNLGVNGHSYKSQYFRHFLLLKFNKKPKIIIQTLDVTSFDKSSDFYNPDQYLPYMLNNKEMKQLTYNEYQPIDYKLPMIRYFGKKEAFMEIIKLLLNPASNKPLRVKGYLPRDIMWNDDLIKAQEKLGSFEVKSDSSIIRLFEKYLNECHQLNIQVIFVYTPEYVEGQKFVSNRSDIMTIYNQFSQKYNIPFYDYSNDSMSYHKEYFYNSGHLNKEGAELFTSRLINDLRKLSIMAEVDTKSQSGRSGRIQN
jgi:hypothetical protein